jgi:uncharacterized protein
MLVYTANKLDFMDDVQSNIIEAKILDAFKRHLGHSTSTSEIASWKNSMKYMSKILVNGGIPNDAGVAIEYTLPQTSKRIDFILTGKGENQNNTAIIIELKQWTEAKASQKDGIISTFIGRSEREVNHPSYQAWVYSALLEDFNEAVQEENILLKPCAYLHNCISDDVINDHFYDEHTKKAPAFLRKDDKKLIEFINQYVKYGDSDNIMYRIDNGRIRPSKNLADKLDSLLKGNQEFLMIDDQKIVYETAIDLSKKSTVKKKNVLIVQGGPGTGKSVVAVNLLVEFTKKFLVAQYVTKNLAPREVYASKLIGSFKKSHINNLFKGSGSYTESEAHFFDVLIVDEAHRLNEKSGMYQNKGENQIKEIIAATKLSVFFIDEDQRVTMRDIGDNAEIKKWAIKLGARVNELELQSQFRCNGSDGYLAWVDNSLQIRETANETLSGINYDFKVFDSPNELRDAIYRKNRINNKARLVAGYCWNWISKNKNDDSLKDITIKEHNFAMKWNLASDGNLWILKPESVSEVGCIHTCQGLEIDYVGVIIGPDFVVRDGLAVVSAEKRAKTDSSIKGYKKLFKTKPKDAKVKAEIIIKNTYRTLMTRGAKGCYIFCTDPETNAYFKERIGAEFESSTNIEQVASSHAFDIAQQEVISTFPGLTLRILNAKEVKPYQNSVPIYDLAIAAGQFSSLQEVNEVPKDGDIGAVEQYDWVELPDAFRHQPGLFVAKVIGESMNRRIPNGSWCLFKLEPVGTRQGKVVLVQHRDIDDIDTGGHYTIKVYESEKESYDDGSWKHKKIILRPDTTAPGYEPIVLNGEEAGELKVIAELVAVLG